MNTPSNMENRTLRISRDYNAEPQKVFDAWTKPEQLVQWWGPEGVHIPAHKLDVREGGAWRTVMENDKGEQFIVSGVYKTVEIANRLVFTWAWEQEDGSRGYQSEVDILFEAISDGTRLNIVHSVFEDNESRDQHNMGWTSSLNCLEAFLN